MKDLAKKTESELQKLLAEKRVGLREIRFGTAGSKHKNTMEARNVKKEIARIQTELRNKN